MIAGLLNRDTKNPIPASLAASEHDCSLCQFWDLETLGIGPDENANAGKEDMAVQQY